MFSFESFFSHLIGLIRCPLIWLLFFENGVLFNIGEPIGSSFSPNSSTLPRSKGELKRISDGLDLESLVSSFKLMLTENRTLRLVAVSLCSIFLETFGDSLD